MNKVIALYILNKKQNSGLVVLSLLSMALMLLRVKFTHDIYLLFLIWNLFLAFIPYFFSSKIKTTVPGTLQFYSILIGWLIFLPNSFYLITDFVHLQHISTIQYLFDALLLSSFSIAGFYAGLLSLHDVHLLLLMKYTPKRCKCIIATLSYLAAFGIYLGRMRRFNSWDTLNHPVTLFNAIINSLLQTESHLFTLLLGTFILLVYLVVYRILIQKITSK